MTDTEYILATNVARLVGALDLLRMVFIGDEYFIQEKEFMEVMRKLKHWRDKTAINLEEL